MIKGLILAAVAYFIVELIWGKKRDQEIESNLPKGNFLIVDTETVGNLDEIDFLTANSTKFPRLQQICWILIDPKGKELERKNYLIQDASLAAKIKAPNAKTLSLSSVMDGLKSVLANANYLVAHNVEFDKNVLKGESERNSLSIGITELQTICTMKLATNHCKLLNYGKYKWPKLPELHNCLFNEEIEEKHEAEYDADICLKCFKQMYNDRIIEMKDVHQTKYYI